VGGAGHDQRGDGPDDDGGGDRRAGRDNAGGLHQPARAFRRVRITGAIGPRAIGLGALGQGAVGQRAVGQRAVGPRAIRARGAGQRGAGALAIGADRCSTLRQQLHGILLWLPPVSQNLHVISGPVKGFSADLADVPFRAAAILVGMPDLVRPTMAVQASFLAGERAACTADGTPAAWLDRAAADFPAFVRASQEDRVMWGVPMTELWYVSGPAYLGSLAIRHRLTPELRREGGHVGYNVVPEHRRQGHATAMLAAGLALCRARGLAEVLVTCDADNLGSRRVIEANAGVLEPAGSAAGDRTCRYWIST
jgi:predicted acetyltransferase